MSETVRIEEGFRPGAIGRIVELHALYYSTHWGMGRAFETRVASGLADFADRYDRETDLVLLALAGEKIVGSLVLDLNDPSSGERGAHLRFFILSDSTAGTGIGSRMLDRAMTHADRHCGGKCWLTTFAGLEAARHMYEKRGFVLTHSQSGTRWGYEHTDQTFERDPKAP